MHRFTRSRLVNGLYSMLFFPNPLSETRPPFLLEPRLTIRYNQVRELRHVHTNPLRRPNNRDGGQDSALRAAAVRVGRARGEVPRARD